LLDDKDIDGVIIATPDHWHARIGILACQAGKDIYIEKPLTQSIRDGQLVRDAVRKYKRVAQVGTQNRSAPFYQAPIDYLKTGKLGKICEISAWMCQVRPSIGNPPDSDPPATVDYDVWLGRRPSAPSTRTVSITTGASSGIMEIVNWVTRECMPWTWLFGGFRRCGEGSKTPCLPGCRVIPGFTG